MQSVLDDLDAGAPYAKYSTQELLDVLCMMCQTDKFFYGAIKARATGCCAG
jgi:hypothetical protein